MSKQNVSGSEFGENICDETVSNGASPVQCATGVEFKISHIENRFDDNESIDECIDDGTNLLAASVKHSTKICGHPSSNKLRILYYGDKLYLPRSEFELNGPPKILSMNCDGDILVVNYSAQGQSFIEIFTVNSFLCPKDLDLMQSMYFVSMAHEIKWNPTSEVFAVCFEDGSLIICRPTPDSLETVDVDIENARCISWDSQGGELFIASPNGILQKYDIRENAIVEIAGPQMLYDPMALEVLSTHQLAAVFMPTSATARPEFYIVNISQDSVTYIRIGDIFYKPFPSTVYLVHLPKQNVLLTGSKNDGEINVLTTFDLSETPLWGRLQLVDGVQTHLPQITTMFGVVVEKHSAADETISVWCSSGNLLSIDLTILRSERSPSIALANAADTKIVFVCHICSRPYKTKRNFAKHLEQQHSTGQIEFIQNGNQLNAKKKRVSKRKTI